MAVKNPMSSYNKARRQKLELQKLYEAKEWYTIRAILGNQWANWFILAGARERGKTFSVQDFVLNQYFNPNQNYIRSHSIG